MICVHKERVTSEVRDEVNRNREMLDIISRGRKKGRGGLRERERI
jgi:hypothetical protein